MPPRMLLYKAWLDTRWRFWIGLLVVAMAACGVVLSYPRALEVLAAVERTPSAVLGSGPFATRLADAIAHGRVYRGFVFTQLFQQELPQIWCLFAMLLGAGGIVSQSARGGALFTLSLPVSRHQIVTARAAVVLLELLALSVVPALLIAGLSPVVGQSYSLSESLVHAALLFGGGIVFFSFTFLMSSIFADPWRPPLLMAAIFFLIATIRMVVPGFTRFTLAPIITGSTYYFDRSVPWTGLLLSMLTSAILLILAARNIGRRDF